MNHCRSGSLGEAQKVRCADIGRNPGWNPEQSPGLYPGEESFLLW